MSNGELDGHVRSIIGMNRLIGPNAVKCRLANEGFRVQRERVRQAMQRVDPAGFVVRRTRRIVRRQYRVAGPNSLWHVDGNQKLITWRLTVHAGVDGDTRTITFIDVADNNRAETVCAAFVRGIVEYGVPSRLRIDGGGENSVVARLMEIYRGFNRGSVICGQSVHNQRVERMWGDVWRGTTNCFYDLFRFLEREGHLDANNDAHLYALHYVFIPRIRRSCSEFQQYWNSHGIRTAHHMTPHQMFILHSLNMFHSPHTAIRDLFRSNAPRNAQGEYHPRNNDIRLHEPVEVPLIPRLLTEENLAVLRREVDPLDASDTTGISLYLRTLQFIMTTISRS